MKATPVRAPILRRYLEATFGGGPETAAAVEGATLDEYVTLRRIRFPGSTPQGAARAAPTRELRNAGATLDAAPPPTKPPLRRFTEVKGLQHVDLGSHAIPQDVQILSLKGIRAITGWTGLRRFEALEDLAVVACGGSLAKGKSPAVTLRHLQLHSCSAACMSMALDALRAEEMVIDAEVFDARMLEGRRDLKALHLSAGYVRNVIALAGLSTTTLGIGWIDPGASATDMLKGVGATTTVLSLRGTRPFGPDLLPKLPVLERLSVPGYQEYRDDWIGWALVHRDVVTEFTSVLPPPNGLSLAEVCSGVEIIQVKKGKKTAFEVSGDFAAELHRRRRFDGNNGDLEDELSAVAKRAKKRIQWSSEADSLVAQAADLATARWIVELLVKKGLRDTAS